MDSIFKPAGFLRLATIQKVYENTMVADITFNNYTADISSDISLRPSNQQIYKAQLPVSYLSTGGGFIGGKVGEGTTVAVGQVEGNSHYFIVAFLARDPGARGTIPNKQINIPKLEDGVITIQSNKNSSIRLTKETITIGEPTNSFLFDSKRKLLFNTVNYSYSVNQYGREISGAILRDRRPKINFTSSQFRATDPGYDDGLKRIGMDPIANTTSSTYAGIARNPARIEKREVVLEYEDISKVQSNDIELKLYNPDNSLEIKNIINRRESRSDALSLSLVSPNYLLETIKGTVVDIYGNILDINRNIIPIGKDENLSVSKIKSTLTEQNTNKNIYEQIKRAERRSLAYHFEINARKEGQGSGPPDISVRDNFARDRSRFYLDIDKEGQFKLNVPASSNTGNIPLLTRYENYSTVFPNDRSKDPNDLVFNDDYRDILIESFIENQPVSLVDEGGNIAGPKDRFSDTNDVIYIGHGTVYHDISSTCSSSTEVNFYDPQEGEETTLLGSGLIDPLGDIVSKTIIVSGPDANAGNRSGSINFDGSIDLNIGANTVDNQSLWLDTEGGIVGNIGADNNDISAAISMDGGAYIELGNGDSSKPKVLDIKVFNGQGGAAVFRMDKSGLSVSTQGRFVVYSAADMMFRSMGTITIDGERVVIQGRDVIKDPGKGPFK